MSFYDKNFDESLKRALSEMENDKNAALPNIMARLLIERMIEQQEGALKHQKEVAELKAKLRWWRIGSLIAALLMLAGCVALRLA
jgi:anti-sigma-K factor RskA